MRLLAFLVLLIPTLALADAIQLTWDMPNQRVDGTALEVSEIDGYAIDYTHNNGPQQTIIVDGGLTLEHILLDVQAGTYVFQIATISLDQVGPSSNPVTVTLDNIQKVGASAPVIRVQLSCENCNLEIK